ncbi:hypothetical protein [Chryseobacterium sp.]|uniref:hypothetical protein n=1 Tax=Chryseobacterium sp. TaxID=1871047 RepID=UPI0025BAC4A7|nr:hypothetical protein [Chryseobacterium sp.]MBV8327455.1 hypothetical protein [Chryseobacterium sp.]
MSKKDLNNANEKALEQLSKSLQFESVNENEAGQLAGGFSEAVSEEQLEDININIFKCKCATKPETGLNPA